MKHSTLSFCQVQYKSKKEHGKTLLCDPYISASVEAQTGVIKNFYVNVHYIAVKPLHIDKQKEEVVGGR